MVFQGQSFSLQKNPNDIHEQTFHFYITSHINICQMESITFLFTMRDHTVIQVWICIFLNSMLCHNHYQAIGSQMDILFLFIFQVQCL